MPITIDLVDSYADQSHLDKAFGYFTYVDETFSTYKPNSEIEKIKRGEISAEQYSPDVRRIFALAEITKQETDGYFDIGPLSTCDPSGIVKGWSIFQVAELLAHLGLQNYFVDAGGDIEVRGLNSDGGPWQIGIRHPFENENIVKALSLTNQGIATSGNYVRGNHIYDPKTRSNLDEIVSISVVGPSVYEADRFATAAYAMGKQGIHFIESRPGLEAYMIDSHGVATFTSQFDSFVTTGV